MTPTFDLDAHLHRTALPAPGGDARAVRGDRADRRGAAAPRPAALGDVGDRGARSAGASRWWRRSITPPSTASAARSCMCGLLDADRDAPLRSALPKRRPSRSRLPRRRRCSRTPRYAFGAQPLRGARQILRSTGTGARLALPRSRSAESPLPSAPRTRLNGARHESALGSAGQRPARRREAREERLRGHRESRRARRVRRRAAPLPRRARGDPAAAARGGGADGARRSARATGSAIRSRRCSCGCRCTSPTRSSGCAPRARRASRRCARTSCSATSSNEWADLVSPALLAGAAQLYTRLGLADHVGPVVNLVMSNVPGPTMPLYCAGARVTACHPIGPIYDGCALNLTVMSYDGSLGIGAIGCPERCPRSTRSRARSRRRWTSCSRSSTALPLDRRRVVIADGRRCPSPRRQPL